MSMGEMTTKRVRVYLRAEASVTLEVRTSSPDDDPCDLTPEDVRKVKRLAAASFHTWEVESVEVDE